MDALAAAFFGAMAGMLLGALLIMQLSRWGLLLYVNVTKHGGDFLGEPRRRLLWAFPFVALLHPALWALVAVLWSALHVLRHGASSFQWGLLVGASLYLVPMLLSAVVMLFRVASGPKPPARI